MASNVPKFGRLVFDSNAKRDAVHMAVVPVYAGEDLKPGQKVSVHGRVAYRADGDTVQGVGVVDPFLNQVVSQGDRFWLILNQDTITGLRHDWTHPDLPSDLEEEEWGDPGCKGCN